MTKSITFIVAQASKVRLIGESRKKDDRLDPRTLARLARIDPAMASPGGQVTVAHAMEISTGGPPALANPESSVADRRGPSQLHCLCTNGERPRTERKSPGRHCRGLKLPMWRFTCGCCGGPVQPSRGGQFLTETWCPVPEPQLQDR